MDKFDIACDYVLENEGGYIDDKDDQGGETKFGISQRFIYSNELQKEYPNVRLLTTRNAKDIYKKYFWDCAQFEKINDIEIITKIFDACINIGMSSAIKIVQEAINKISGNVVKVDGILGTKTAITLNCLDKQQLLRFFECLWIGYYLKIVVSNPSQLKFLMGWFNRVIKKVE